MALLFITGSYGHCWGFILDAFTELLTLDQLPRTNVGDVTQSQRHMKDLELTFGGGSSGGHGGTGGDLSGSYERYHSDVTHINRAWLCELTPCHQISWAGVCQHSCLQWRRRRGREQKLETSSWHVNFLVVRKWKRLGSAATCWSHCE